MGWDWDNDRPNRGRGWDTQHNRSKNAQSAIEDGALTASAVQKSSKSNLIDSYLKNFSKFDKESEVVNFARPNLEKMPKKKLADTLYPDKGEYHHVGGINNSRDNIANYRRPANAEDDKGFLSEALKPDIFGFLDSKNEADQTSLWKKDEKAKPFDNLEQGSRIQQALSFLSNDDIDSLLDDWRNNSSSPFVKALNQQKRTEQEAKEKQYWDERKAVQAENEKNIQNFKESLQRDNPGFIGQRLSQLVGRAVDYKKQEPSLTEWDSTNNLFDRWLLGKATPEQAVRAMGIDRNRDRDYSESWGIPAPKFPERPADDSELMRRLGGEQTVSNAVNSWLDEVEDKENGWIAQDSIYYRFGDRNELFDTLKNRWNYTPNAEQKQRLDSLFDTFDKKNRDFVDRYITPQGERIEKRREQGKLTREYYISQLQNALALMRNREVRTFAPDYLKNAPRDVKDWWEEKTGQHID